VTHGAQVVCVGKVSPNKTSCRKNLCGVGKGREQIKLRVRGDKRGRKLSRRLLLVPERWGSTPKQLQGEFP